jgi:hypothetical protein
VLQNYVHWGVPEGEKVFEFGWLSKNERETNFENAGNVKEGSRLLFHQNTPLVTQSVPATIAFCVNTFSDDDETNTRKTTHEEQTHR